MVVPPPPFSGELFELLQNRFRGHRLRRRQWRISYSVACCDACRRCGRSTEREAVNALHDVMQWRGIGRDRPGEKQ